MAVRGSPAHRTRAVIRTILAVDRPAGAFPPNMMLGVVPDRVRRGARAVKPTRISVRR